jgi:hypothetical protein
MRFSTHPNVRQATCKVLEMMDEGVLDPAAIVRECLAYMSESDVADMAQRIGWLEEEEEDEDEESKD